MIIKVYFVHKSCLLNKSNKNRIKVHKQDNTQGAVNLHLLTLDLKKKISHFKRKLDVKITNKKIIVKPKLIKKIEIKMIFLIQINLKITINIVIDNLQETNKHKSHNLDQLNVLKLILIKIDRQNQNNNAKDHSNRHFIKPTSNIVSIWKESSIVTSITSNLSSPKIDNFSTISFIKFR